MSPGRTIESMAEREGFELVCRIDGAEFVDFITRTVSTALSFKGLPVQNRVHVRFYLTVGFRSLLSASLASREGILLLSLRNFSR
jgi:hypothetical protein